MHLSSSDAPRTLAPRRDLDALAWVAEQYAVRFDQLGALLEGSPHAAYRVGARLHAAGLATSAHVLAGEPAWLIPTAKGLRACGSSFRPWQPRLGRLAHVGAVTDVRLHVRARAPESTWVCERTLACQRAAREHLVDAIVLLDGHDVAIEVELTVKGRRRTEAIVDELAGRFDAVVYFCAPAPRRLLGALQASGRWPALQVRELPRRADV